MVNMGDGVFSFIFLFFYSLCFSLFIWLLWSAAWHGHHWQFDQNWNGCYRRHSLLSPCCAQHTTLFLRFEYDELTNNISFYSFWPFYRHFLEFWYFVFCLFEVISDGRHSCKWTINIVFATQFAVWCFFYNSILNSHSPYVRPSFYLFLYYTRTSYSVSV